MKQTQTLDPRADTIQRVALIAGVVGLILCAVDAFIDPTGFFQSYLIAFLFWLAFPLGSMAIVALYHLGGGAWGFGIRRPLEAGMMTVPLMALLFVPLLFGLPNLYPWARPAEVAADPILQHRAPFPLNPQKQRGNLHDYGENQDHQNRVDKKRDRIHNNAILRTLGAPHFCAANWSSKRATPSGVRFS